MSNSPVPEGLDPSPGGLYPGWVPWAVGAALAATLAFLFFWIPEPPPRPSLHPAGRALLQARLAHDPGDRAARLALAAGDPRSAYAAARRELALAPEDRGLRVRAARMAEWAGRPEEALSLWLALAMERPEGEPYERALELARALFRHEDEARLLERRDLLRPLDAAGLRRLVGAWEGAGRPEAAVAYLARRNDPEALRLRARLLELMGWLEDALAVRRRLAEDPGAPEDRLRLADLLARLGRFEAARAALGPEDPSEGPRALRVRAGLAWLTGRLDEARRALLALDRREALDLEGSQRLLALLPPPQGLEEAYRAWWRHRDPELLLSPVERALAGRRWPRLARLLAEARGVPTLARRPELWRIVAEEAVHRGDPAATGRVLALALDLDPEDQETRAAWLWLQVEHAPASRLERVLAREGRAAGARPALWEPLGAGYLRLGRDREAARWYGRAAAHRPRDPLLLLGWAEALETLGRRRAARALRGLALRLLLPRAPELLAGRGEGARRLAGGLLRRRLGAEVAEPWLRTLLRPGPGGEPPSEAALLWAAAWWLDLGRTPLARRALVVLRARGREPPPSLELAVALRGGDRRGAARALERALKRDRGGSLEVTERLAALRLLDREGEAEALARRALARAPGPGLRREAAELAAARPRGAAAAVERRRVGPLALREARLAGALARGAWRWRLAALRRRLDGDPRLLDLAGRRLEALAERRGALTLGLGAELLRRGDGDLAALRARLDGPLPLGRGWRAAGSLVWGRPAEDGGAARALAVEDRLGLALRGPWDTVELEAELAAEGRRARGAGGARLARGWSAAVRAALPLRRGWTGLRAEAYAQLRRLRLAEALPPALAAALPGGGGVGAVLAPDYREAGVGLRLARGLERPFGGVGHGLRYQAALTLFRSAPSGGAGLAAELALGVSLLGGDELALAGRYSDARGGVDTRPDRSLGLR